jgi:hypothetical protein
MPFILNQGLLQAVTRRRTSMTATKDLRMKIPELDSGKTSRFRF